MVGRGGRAGEGLCFVASVFLELMEVMERLMSDLVFCVIYPTVNLKLACSEDEAFTQPDVRAESLRLGAAGKLEGWGEAISCQQMAPAGNSDHWPSLPIKSLFPDGAHGTCWQVFP